MKKSASKKILSLFLAVMMLTSCIPMTVYAAPTDWTEFASSDFTYPAGTDSSNTCWGSGAANGDYTSFTGSQANKLLQTDYGMSWNINLWSGTTTTLDCGTKGTLIRDGYMYLTNYSGSTTTPVTGLDCFKIDLEFSFYQDFTITTGTDEYCFFKLGTSPTLGMGTSDMWNNNVFAQDAYGRVHVGGTGYTSGAANRSISTESMYLTTGVDYHYVMTYSNGYVRTFITDDEGVVIETIYGGKHTLDTANINNIMLGSDDNDYFMHDIRYKSVSFYTGSENIDSVNQDSTKNKYLFTYFTGNSTEGETLHMAVSDDGYNFEALNGNNPVWDTSVISGSLESYPDNSGVAASGHVRDPYAFQAEDGTYYILATDLNTENGKNWGNNSKLLVWHLNDLADIATAQPWNIDTQSLVGSLCGGSVSRAWAPQAIYDKNAGHYMLYWAVGYINGGTYMHYVYTDDFKTFLTEPKQLLTTTGDNIDGDITYDGQFYYLWYKDDSSDKIGYATSENANGPYSTFVEFTDTDYSSYFEGPQVYRIQATGEYVLLADHYSSARSFFAAYSSNSLSGFQNNQNKTLNINHLYPRHGSVMNITTDQYNKLVKAFGKATYDYTGVEQGKTVNDYLLARYFTTDDVTYDATGNGNTLTNSGVTAVQDLSGKVCAQFTGGSSSTQSGTYEKINTSNMFSNITAKDGVTFSWYGYANNASPVDGSNGTGRFFDWSDKEAGTLAWDSDGTLPGNTQRNSAYVYCAANMEYGGANNGEVKIANGYKGSTYGGAWHLYTMTVVNGFINFYVDGTLLKTVYAKNGESVTKAGSPNDMPSLNEAMFSNMKNGNLYFGVSSYAADGMLDGYISDFRIYGRALSTQDIIDSLDALENYIPGESVNTNSKIYYDPMEDIAKGTDSSAYPKTNYGAATVQDPATIHNNVLSVAGGVEAHNPATYSGSSTASLKGYTISLWYNPGETITTGETIFNIGNDNTTFARRYFEILEDGNLHFAYDASTQDDNYINASAVFGKDGLKANDWNHITVQIAPNGTYDYIYIYLDGVLTKKINYYTEANAKTAGYSLHDYFQKDWTVHYGNSCGYWSNASNGYMDDFTIFNEVYSAKSVYQNDCLAIAGTLIDIAKQRYVDAMDNITANGDFVYTNMAEAYKAYDAVVRYEDAMKYGGVAFDSVKVVELFTNLVNAINAMKEYRKPQTIDGIAASEYANFTNSINGKYTNNLLTKPALGTFREKYKNKNATSGETGTSDNVNARVSNINFVWLYTGIEGDTPTAPINGGIYKNGNTTIYQQAIYIPTDTNVTKASNYLSLGSASDKTWRISNSQTADWYYDTTPQWSLNGVKGDYGTNGVRTGVNEWRYGSNYLNYTGNPTTSGTKVNDYLTSYSDVLFGTYSHWTGAFGSKGYNNFYVGELGTIKVINFEPVRTALLDKQRKSILGAITEYNPEDAFALLNAYDALTSQSYILNGYSEAENLSTTLQTKVNTLKGVDLSKIEHKADYSGALSSAESEQTFLNEIVKDESTGVVSYVDTQGVEHKYTLSSWKAYETAVNAIKEHFASLDPKANIDPDAPDMPYATSQEQVNILVKHINDAKAVLMEIADYSSVDLAISNTSVKSNYNSNNVNSNGQIYAYGTWKAFTEAYSNADIWYQKDSAYRYDTNMYKADYVKKADGPYIAYDQSGNIVTSDSQVIDHYTFIGVFYDNADDANPSQFNTGDFVKINGVTTQLNGHRYYVTKVYNPVTAGNSFEYSSSQIAINSAGNALKDTNTNLDPVADYTAYDATIDLIKYQDIAAFSDEYLGSGSSIYDTLNVQGVPTVQQPFSTGVSNVNSEVCTTPGYSVNNTAYVNVGNVIYKNTGESAQDVLDNTTTNILTALQSVNNDETTSRRSYNVTFKVYSNETGSEVQVGSDEISTAYYGQSVTKTVPVGYTSYKWVVSANGTEMTIPSASSYTTKIQSDVVIEVYCSNDADVSGNVKVQIQNIYGNTVQEYSVSEQTQIVLADGSYTIGSFSTVALDTIPYYAFNGWNINGSPGNNGTYTLADIKDSNSVVVLTPKYVNTSSPYVVTVDGVAINGVDGKELYYDSKAVASKSAGSYALAILNPDSTYSVVTYDDEYAFYAVGDAAFYSISFVDGVYKVNGNVISDSEMIRKLNSKLPFVYSISLYVDGKFTVYSGVTQGTCGATITEVGTVYSTTANSTDTLIIGGTGVNSLVAKKPVDTDQYYLRFNTTKAVNARAYVKYSYNPTINSGNINQGTLIQTIDYGNICSKSAS